MSNFDLICDECGVASSQRGGAWLRYYPFGGEFGIEHRTLCPICSAAHEAAEQGDDL